MLFLCQGGRKSRTHNKALAFKQPCAIFSLICRVCLTNFRWFGLIWFINYILHHVQ